MLMLMKTAAWITKHTYSRTVGLFFYLSSPNFDEIINVMEKIANSEKKLFQKKLDFFLWNFGFFFYIVH